MGDVHCVDGDKPWQSHSVSISVVSAVWSGAHLCWRFATGGDRCWVREWEAGQGIHGEGPAGA